MSGERKTVKVNRDTTREERQEIKEKADKAWKAWTATSKPAPPRGVIKVKKH